MKTPAGEQLEDMLLCPISGEVMTDPVVDPEGNSYEKSAILDWLSRNNTSPITRAPLRPNQLTPNRVLRDLLELRKATAEEERQELQKKKTAHKETNATASPKVKVDLKAFYEDSHQGGNAHGGNTPGAHGTQGLVQICVADDESRDHHHTPSQVVCVIDVSYSMDSAAKMHGDSEGSAGLSLLDIVKHATATVIETLGDNDRLAIVAYASKGEIILPFTAMNKQGRKKANLAVKNLRTCGNTNIWDGLRMAMELVSNETTANNASILLLTDGLPNIHPPRGELQTLVRYKEAHPDLDCRISTFGFGYSLDSQLLNDIAVEGGGHYGFIPDSSFVGTVFINATSNILSTAIPQCQLLLEAEPGVTFERCLSLNQQGSSFVTSWGMAVSVPGGLRYGQTFDVLVEMKDERSQDEKRSVPPFVSTLQFSGAEGWGPERPAAAIRSGSSDTQIEAAAARHKVVDLIRASLDPKTSTKLAQKSTKSLIDEIRSSRAATTNDKTKALLEDLTGQITEAYSRPDWFAKWGRHYLLSLARAHELQQCSNFKDPGVQVYSTKKFALIRDRAEDLFCKLPPPTPSLARDDANGKRVRRVVSNMRAYHNAGAPCFAEGMVMMADGRFVSVKDIVAGDEVATSGAMSAVGRRSSARVRCVVTTACEGGVAPLVDLGGGVLVTSWHPVRPARGGGVGAWRFPCDLALAVPYSCDKVYSFVLEEGAAGVMQIGPYEAVTLGHGLDDDAVARHAYLGTDRVIRDLSRMDGWREGRIDLGPNPAVRDKASGLIVSFVQEKTQTARVGVAVREPACACANNQTEKVCGDC